MKVNTNPVRGMKDFLPDEAELREKVRRTIIDTYSSFGYRKIETPALEHLELLGGSDGGENEKLIYKVLKRGEKLDLTSATEEKDLSEEGLRFDLTVPLTRIYANNQNELPLPFKVIQTDNVWRAERPQKGRYRQFMQCDIDIIGEETYVAEIDLLTASSHALLNLGFSDFVIKINDRMILHDLAEKWGFERKDHESVFITIDKLDKIGTDGVAIELGYKRFSNDAINTMTADLNDFQAGRFENVKISDDLRIVIDTVSIASQGRFKIEFDPTLVRGMGYYTGMIYEIKYRDYPGSVGGGGRYDKMIGKRTGTDVPACGFSIGFERIIDLMLERHDQTEKPVRLAVLFNTEKDDTKTIYYYSDAYRSGTIALTHKEKSSGKIFKKDVSVFRQEKKLGKQLKKLLDQGFTHYATLLNNDVLVVEELKADKG